MSKKDKKEVNRAFIKVIINASYATPPGLVNANLYNYKS
jgi:hypothetical protein